MNDHTRITPLIRDRILQEAAQTDAARDAASLVLDMLVAEQIDVADGAVDLDEVKQLLVDALRASRGGGPTRREQVAG